MPRSRHLFLGDAIGDRLSINVIILIYINILRKIYGGGGGIRTHGTLLTYVGFQDRCIKPLCHSSDLSEIALGGRFWKGCRIVNFSMIKIMWH